MESFKEELYIFLYTFIIRQRQQQYDTRL